MPDDTRWNYKVRAYTILPEENHYSGRYDPITGTIPGYIPEETIYSDWTQEYNVSTINLATTMDPVVNNIPRSVTVSWRKVSSAEGYLVYCTEEKDDANRKLLTITEAGETTYTDSTAIPGAFYRYEVIPYLGMEFVTCNNTITVKVKEHTQSSSTDIPTKGQKLSDSKTGAVYKVVSAKTKGGMVEYTKPLNNKTANISIPATVKINGISYKVTSIAAN